MFIILSSVLRRARLLYTTLWLARINWQNHFLYVCACGTASMCVLSAVFFPQLWDEIWEETDRFPSACFICKKKKKKKKALLAIQIYALAPSPLPPPPLPSLLLYPSGICGWPGHQESQGLREEQGGAGGKRKKRGARERKRKREQAPLNSYFPSTTPACQPACSLFSFELSILPQHRKKKKKSIHISIIHTSVCLHVYAPLLPPVPLLLSLGLPLSLSPSPSPLG